MIDTGSFCGNEEFIHVSTQYIDQRTGLLMVVDDVSVLVYSFCGEKYYNIKTLKQRKSRFEAIYQHGKPPAQQVSIPLESWNSLKQTS